MCLLHAHAHAHVHVLWLHLIVSYAQVPELVEAARRQLLRIASEASQPWGTPAAKEEWHNSAMNRHAPLSEQATSAELDTRRDERLSE